MAYEIPYDSNYGSWYGTPQNVTRLSAVLEQTLDEEGYPIGVITASWDMPDNGGTFNALLSTDGTNYYVAENGIRNNSVILEVSSNTDYYLKIITVLGVEQSSGSVSSLLSSSITEIPPTPIVSAVQGGMRINVGTIPFSYSVEISINDGTNTTVLYATEIITTYLCDAGTYTVSTAYVNASNDVGTSSSSASVTVSELATADDYVEKTSADYIKSASVSGNTLTLTKGNDGTVTFTPSGGGGGSYTAGDGIDISNDVISLETASANDIGGIKVGSGLSIDGNGVLSATGGGGSADVYNLKTHSVGVYLQDDGVYYSATTDDYIITQTDANGGSSRNYYKYNNVPALIGIAKVTTSNTWCSAILISLSPEGVTNWQTYNGRNTPTLSQGSFYDSARDVTWYYSCSEANHPWKDSSMTTAQFPRIGGDSANYSSYLEAAQALLADANPTLVGTVYEEDLFSPTGFTLTSGDTISSDLLQSLITYHRPIVVNGQTFYPLDSSTAGTYIYYSRDYNISVDSSTREITITPNSSGYVLPIASANTLGGIKVGNNLSIDANGVLSASGGGGGGGGSGGVTVTNIFTSASGVSSGDITLTDNWNNYDFISVTVWTGQTTYAKGQSFWSKDFLEELKTNSYRFINIRYNTSYVTLQPTSNYNKFTIPESGGNAKIYSIDGYKIGGGGSSYTETVLFSNSSGITSGSIPLDYNLSDYNMIQFTLVRTSSATPKEIVTNMATSGAVKNASRFCIYGFDNDYFDLIYASETSLTIYGYRNVALTEVLGIKF